MAYDDILAGRVRRQLSSLDGVVERKMFGGLAYLINGNMSVGIQRDDLIARIDPTSAEDLLGRPGARPFDLTGRPMKGWLLVDASAIESDVALNEWVHLGESYARSLPPK
jgi:TfoX/Sxy family transcriptional regulator of competence genes